MSENKPSIRERVARGESMSDILVEQNQQQEELEESRANKPKKIHKRLSLGETMKEERARKRKHPTSGSTRSIPDRWSPQSKPDKPER